MNIEFLKSHSSLLVSPRIWTGERWDYDWFDHAESADIGSGEMLAITNPQLVLEEHRLLLEAGADAISTMTCGAVATTMAKYGRSDYAAEANCANARLARAACDDFTTPDRVRTVLGSIGPGIHLLSLLGGGDKASERIQSEYYTQAEALFRGGVDSCRDARNSTTGVRKQ